MSRKTTVELTNMCLIEDSKHRVLVEEKIGTRHQGGLVFPGGHVEEGESLHDSIVREMREETGLTIHNPRLCGVKDWIEPDGTRYIVFLYKVTEFEGDICSSEEGKIFWLTQEELPDAHLIWNMRELLEIFNKEENSEFYFDLTKGTSKDGILL